MQQNCERSAKHIYLSMNWNQDMRRYKKIQNKYDANDGKISFNTLNNCGCRADAIDPAYVL